MRGRRRALRSYPTLKVRKGSGEEIVQGKEQWLRFAGAAVKRYPTPKVRKTQAIDTYFKMKDRDLGSIPGLGRSPGEGKAYPF